MFRRLDVTSGRVRWETDARRTTVGQYFFHGNVFVAPDLVVAGADDPAATADAAVHAFDRNSGREVWRFPVGRGVLGALVGPGRRIYAHAINGDVIALDLDSGKLEWRRPLRVPAWESPGVSGRRVFAGSADGALYALNSDTGEIEWQQKLGGAVATSVRVAPQGVYVGTADGVIHRLSAARGEILASLQVDAALKPTAVPVIAGDAAFVLLADAAADYRAVVSLDAGLTRVRWRQAAPERWTTSRVFATSKTIFLGTPSGEVAAYCGSDGSLAWTHKLGDAPIRTIGGSDDVLYVGTRHGTLYAVRPPRSCK